MLCSVWCSQHEIHNKELGEERKKEDVIQRVEDNDEWLFRGLNPARYFHESVLVPQLQVKKKINITVNIYFRFRNSIL
jgi:hypothetical protein